MLRAPRYGTASLTEVLPSVLAALGDHDWDNVLGLQTAEHAVIVVVDGLGFEQLRTARDVAPLLTDAALARPPIDAAFPTTTPCGLGSLTLAMPPGLHGFVGATFLLPDFDVVLNPLHWDGVPTPAAVQPEPTVFTRTSIPVRSHGPARFAASGMTRVLLDGARPLGYSTFDPSAVRPEPGTLDYVYLPELDKAGHTDGPASAGWVRALRTVEAHVEAIVRALPASSIVLVTADHGMVEVPDSRRIDVDGQQFQAGVLRMAGEPRMRHVHTDAPADVQERWTSALGDRATVLSRAEAIDAGLFGTVDPMLAERIGDVIAIAHADWALTSRIVDPKPSGLRGLHGSLTEAELLVPCAILRGAR